MNIQTSDLNLLRVLDALLRERNVSRAVERLALSQPAVSNALNRLHELLDDPLLVRAGRAMQLTPRALALEAPIRTALWQIEQSLGDGEGFDPGRSRQRFIVAVTGYVELICVPVLIRRLSKRTPGISIATQHLTPALPAEAPDKGELGLVLGRFKNVLAHFQRCHWASETLRLVARRQHPLLAQTPNLATFLELQHLWVHGGQTKGVVDQWLGSQGLKRQVVYTTPNYLQAAHIAAYSDLVGVLPRQLAHYLERLLLLQSFNLSFDLGPFRLGLVFLAQREHDIALQWLVEQIRQVGAARPDQGNPGSQKRPRMTSSSRGSLSLRG